MNSKATIQQHVDLLAAFTQNDLSHVIAGLEESIHGVGQNSIPAFLKEHHVCSELLDSAAAIKRAASQINVAIHALGILSALPHILLPEEIVESVSLGAGNTGRAFDLETSARIAEFKFITWKGGSESIRQNGIFKDFFGLAAADTAKTKYLYLLGTAHALKFLRGRRSLSSVLSKDEATRKDFYLHFGERYKTVGEYYAEHQDKVHIIDISHYVPELVLLKRVEDASE